MASDSTIAVTAVFSPQARQVRECSLQMPAGATVKQAIARSGLLEGLDPITVAGLECGIWGRKVALGHVLRDGDRVEIYRPLRVDPKEARRLRFTGQGRKGAGLFVSKRPGAKAGY